MGGMNWGFAGWRRTIALLSAVLLFACLVAVAGGAEPAAEPEGPVLVVSTGTPGLDHAGSYQEYECDPQLALVAVDLPGCGDLGGEHVRGGSGYIVFGWRSVNAGNAGPVPLHGWLGARLSWDGGDAEFTCGWQHGVFVGCGLYPTTWPPMGAPFHFECYSRPGTIGHWGECFMGHE
jgi:hypothetical protein